MWAIFCTQDLPPRPDAIPWHSMAWHCSIRLLLTPFLYIFLWSAHYNKFLACISSTHSVCMSCVSRCTCVIVWVLAIFFVPKVCAWVGRYLRIQDIKRIQLDFYLIRLVLWKIWFITCFSKDLYISSHFSYHIIFVLLEEFFIFFVLFQSNLSSCFGLSRTHL